jgi:hypothetical protein
VHARHQVRAPLRERVEPGSEQHVLLDAAGDPLPDEVLDEPAPPDHGGAERRRPLLHVGTGAPVVLRSDDPQTHHVVEDVRRRVGVDMERTPQRGADGSAVGFGHRLRV